MTKLISLHNFIDSSCRLGDEVDDLDTLIISYFADFIGQWKAPPDMTVQERSHYAEEIKTAEIVVRPHRVTNPGETVSVVVWSPKGIDDSEMHCQSVIRQGSDTTSLKWTNAASSFCMIHEKWHSPKNVWLALLSMKGGRHQHSWGGSNVTSIIAKGIESTLIYIVFHSMHGWTLNRVGCDRQDYHSSLCLNQE